MLHTIRVIILIVGVFLPTLVMAQGIGLQDGDEAGFVNDNATAAVEPETVVAHPQSVNLGDPFLVRVTSNRPLGEVVVHWEGKSVVPSISVWNDKHVALAMLGTDVLNAKAGKKDLVITVSAEGDRSEYKRTVMIRDKEFPRQDLKLPPKMVTPPKEVLDRIARERKIIAKTRSIYSPQREWSLPFFRPVRGSVSSDYGLKRFLNGKPRNPHRGMDFRSPMGNPIKSVADGIVALVGDHYYAGKSVYVDHGNGVISMYFHLSKPTVKEGQRVERGQTVGLTGTTGRVTGPHLHLSIAVQGKLVNPDPLFVKNTDQMLEE
ncbi:M23 family metallopeptidase [Salidesulfovibrio brasiliensis]|uniref:M23 family metallopeptidase n=1 Tax=Salidesulfovibrio brasiliensis TaxID=221711 RepID=UPI0006D1D411|nr:M23 family metallopeptidase [Salidesulfovibrio brasiliensis]